MAYWDGPVEGYPPEHRDFARIWQQPSIGGAELAGLALEAGLVDECHLLLNPVVFGGGKPAFRAAVRRELELLATRRVGTGVIHAHYRVR